MKQESKFDLLLIKHDLTEQSFYNLLSVWREDQKIYVKYEIDDFSKQSIESLTEANRDLSKQIEKLTTLLNKAIA